MQRQSQQQQARQPMTLATLLAAAMLGVSAGQSHADNVVPARVWDNGGADGNWSDANAWNPVGTPPSTAGQITAINNGATVTFNSIGVSVARLYLASDENLAGHLLITGGDLTISELFRPGDEATGSVTQTAGSVTAAAFRMGERGPDWENSSGHGTYNMQGGTLTLTGSAANTVVGRLSATGIFNHTGGTVQQTNATNGGMEISTTASSSVGHGTYNISGNTSVLSIVGTLFVDSTSSTSGATFGGDGYFNVIGNGSTINVGNYTQNEGGHLSFTMDASGASTINVGGNVSLNGTLTLDLTSLTGNPGAIVLINKTSAGAIAGAFTNAAEGDLFGAYQLTYLYDNGGGEGNDLALVLVPEPASLGLLAAAGALVAARRRARHA